MGVGSTQGEYWDLGEFTLGAYCLEEHCEGAGMCQDYEKVPEGLHIPWWDIKVGRAGCIEDGLRIEQRGVRFTPEYETRWRIDC